ncbi:hypothetical protein KB206_15570 [Microvirga sp. STS02]|uniref:hypothetical protein n=1 Tax=Hymenobacter negativus TaxID=2795026 RepID=UPI0018DB0C7E|nr:MULTISPECIES: hypothetical protein [Bacteria]MBH8570310.1 hypothetical protein [Hymenobacter negativus]MBR7210049.1 hypothetical protein [Microvirga sp. STS02]
MIKISDWNSQVVAQKGTRQTTAYDMRLRVLLNNELIAWLLSVVLLGVSVLVAFLTKNTYDSGDSILHFLFARAVPQHPENLLDPWAKPVFTLLAALPSQGGFLGMKLFQCVVVAVSARLAYVTARQLQLPWPALAILFCYAAPDYFRVQFSGLTEPTFGLVLIAAVALAVTNRPVWSAVVLSFLPFVRSEGSMFLGIWTVYLVWNRSWRALPFLFVGYAVYSFVGGLVLGDFTWVFTKNPYGLHSQYGHGLWGRFVESMPTLLGWPLLVFAVLGGLRMLWRATKLREWLQPLFRAELLLIYGSIVAFIVMQSAFWAFGLFGSFGMTRVLVVITPLCVVAALSGLAWLSQLGSSARVRGLIATAGVVAVVVMLFSHDYTYQAESGTNVGWRSTLHWRRDFQESPDMILADQGAAWLKNHDAGYKWHPISFSHLYFAVPMDVDIFNLDAKPPLTKDYAPYLDGVPVGTYIYWDGWFCPVESHLPLELLQKDSRFKQLWKGSIPMDLSNLAGPTFQSVIFERVR